MPLRLTHPGDAILILAGKGHNGDDARCAREHLPGRRVDVLEVKDAAADFQKLDALLLLRPALVIYGLFCIGINRPLDAPWVKFIQRIIAAQLPVLAVDVPSGLNADSGELHRRGHEASTTLTVEHPKRRCSNNPPGNMSDICALPTDVGLSPCPIRSELNWTTPDDFHGFPPRRPVAGHKGTFGHLAIVAGSMGYHGAAVLAARGAQRAQPGLITLFTQEPTPRSGRRTMVQSVMVHIWVAGIKIARRNSNAVIVFGPRIAAGSGGTETGAAPTVARLSGPAPRGCQRAGLAVHGSVS